jgi:hypothetical protein
LLAGKCSDNIFHRLGNHCRKATYTDNRHQTPDRPTLGWAQGIAIGMGASRFTGEQVLVAKVYGDRGGESLLVWLEVDPDDVAADSVDVYGRRAVPRRSRS